MNFKFENFWLSIFVLCVVNTLLIQLIIRPNYEGEISSIEYVLGVAPNFLPAIGMPALLVLTFNLFIKKNCLSNYLIEKKHIVGNMFSVFGLIFWELIQNSFDLIFDWNDVLWTLIGALLFHLICFFVSKKFTQN
jgi:hypothetical protein